MKQCVRVERRKRGRKRPILCCWSYTPAYGRARRVCCDILVSSTIRINTRTLRSAAAIKRIRMIGNFMKAGSLAKNNMTTRSIVFLYAIARGVAEIQYGKTQHIGHPQISSLRFSRTTLPCVTLRFPQRTSADEQAAFKFGFWLLCSSSLDAMLHASACASPCTTAAFSGYRVQIRCNDDLILKYST